jgi:hypothetical protein
MRNITESNEWSRVFPPDKYSTSSGLPNMEQEKVVKVKGYING